MSITADAVIIEPAADHRASVIWLHGLGADGHDFEPIVPELRLPDEYGIRFIFPHAPMRPVTINGGMAMRAWYDVKTQDLRREEDADAIENSKEIINRFIAAEINAGIAAHRIVLAGFSQGGAITLHCGLRYPQRLAGLIALSSYLPLPGRLAAEKSMSSETVPILMLHGVYDPVIPMQAGLQSRDLLKQAGYNVEWHTYPMQHSVCLEEIQRIGRWLEKVLAPS
jgi:phospholipase/carboxylesterase